MSTVMFYHLTQSPIEDVASQLLGRALSAGWRIMLRGCDAVRLDWLDERFWLHPVDGFLPHGREGGPQDADQPILLGQGPITNSAQGLMLVDGAETLPSDSEGLDRIWVLFDGNDDTALMTARRQWKAMVDAGHVAQYWSEQSGRWEKKHG